MTEAKRTRKPSPPRAVPAPVYKKPVVVSEEAKEGREAFKAKRAPDFGQFPRRA